MTAADSNFWRGRRVFLTGHTGFKGAWLALDAERLVDLLDASGQVEWRAVVNVGRLAAQVRSDLAEISEAA